VALRSGVFLAERLEIPSVFTVLAPEDVPGSIGYRVVGGFSGSGDEFNSGFWNWAIAGWLWTRLPSNCVGPRLDDEFVV
jgi:hypothetical protein